MPSPHQQQAPHLHIPPDDPLDRPRVAPYLGGFAAGDVVRCKRRVVPGKTIYQLTVLPGGFRGRALSEPDGTPALRRHEGPWTLSSIEHVPINAIPVWLLLQVDWDPEVRARLLALPLSTTAEEANISLLSPQPEATNTMPEEEDAIGQIDRLELRKACLGYGVALARSTDMTDDAMRSLLRDRGYTPPPKYTRNKVVGTTGRTRLMGEAETLGWPPEYLQVLPLKSLVEMVKQRRTQPEGPAETAILTLCTEIATRQNRVDATLQTLQTLEAEVRIARLEEQAHQVQKAQGEELLRDAKIQLQRSEEARAHLEQRCSSTILDTPENREALALGREILGRRLEINENDTLINRFMAVKGTSE